MRLDIISTVNSHSKDNVIKYPMKRADCVVLLAKTSWRQGNSVCVECVSVNADRLTGALISRRTQWCAADVCEHASRLIMRASDDWQEETLPGPDHSSSWYREQWLIIVCMLMNTFPSTTRGRLSITLIMELIVLLHSHVIIFQLLSLKWHQMCINKLKLRHLCKCTVKIMSDCIWKEICSSVLEGQCPAEVRH